MPENNAADFASAGAGSEKEAVELYDSKHGKYKDEVADNTNTDSKLPTVCMPKAPDPSPFKLGPVSTK